jgi:predicted NBD/HSP70 family sugar kinase
MDSILGRADAGDEMTLDAIAEVGRWLGLGIGNLINVFNPKLVVLGGFYHPLFPFLEKAVFETARSGALGAPGDIADIAPAGLGPDAPLIGAAELALSGVVADPAGSRRARAG